jgi:hypothetical protein
LTAAALARNLSGMAKPKTTSEVTRKNARKLVAGKTVAASNVVTPFTVSEHAIAARAYGIYLEEGRPDGRHLEHWHKAEAELRG